MHVSESKEIIAGQGSAPADSEIARIRILRYFYELHTRAKSVAAGRRSISEVKAELKAAGFKPGQIVPNLLYLVSTGWITKEEVSFPIFSKGVMAKKTNYRISNRGIDHFEGGSRFQEVRTDLGVNITNMAGVVVIGDRNVVRTDFQDLYRHLDVIEHGMTVSEKLSDAQKIEYRSEIETIKSQLGKSSPDKGILSKAWGAISGLSTIAEVADLIEKTRRLIEPLIH